MDKRERVGVKAGGCRKEGRAEYMPVAAVVVERTRRREAGSINLRLSGAA